MADESPVVPDLQELAQSGREIINVPVDKIHKSTLLQDEELALVEMLSIGAHAVRRANIIPGEWVLVVGA